MIGPFAVPSVQWAVSTFTIVSSSSLKCLPEHQPHGGSDVQLAQSGCASQASSALTAAMRCTESAALRAITYFLFGN